MARGTFLSRGLLSIVLAGLSAVLAPAFAAEPTGTVAVVSDIHFDPFAVPELAPRLAASAVEEWPALLAGTGNRNVSRRGEDTNHALLASAVAALSEQGARADLVVVSGDFLAHRFVDSAARALGSGADPASVERLAAGTARYVARALGAALPGKPIVIALGNNDSACGDYRVEPGGPFLAALHDTVRELAGPDRLAEDFGRTYRAAGYYAMQHPVLPQATIVVLNDVLWSTEYRDGCGGDGLDAAEAMMAWFERQLDTARRAGRRVWLVHHIPIGVDSYATARAPAGSSCPARTVPFLQEPFASRFLKLLRDHAAIIQAGFSGHTHQDSYSLVIDAGKAVAVEKVVPSITPVFGNNPGFHLFDYDRQTGDLKDFSTWYLANLDQAAAGRSAEWRREYAFTEAYGEAAYTAAAVQRIATAVLNGNAAGDGVRSTFRRLYPVGHGEIASEALTAYACAIGHPDLASFAVCNCER
jgi:sphingomyelin phosphodiesterase acid-like 3